MLSPHLGSAVYELREGMAHVVVDNVIALIEGRRPPNLLNPEVVVLGGGLIEALSDVMMPRIAKTASAHMLRGTGDGIQIKDSLLGDKAGIFGAAVIARRKTK